MDKFEREVRERISTNGASPELRQTATAFLRSSLTHQYSYNFSWLGRPIIQYPQDILAMQEILWSVQPDLIIEAGIARGGSLIFYASMLELNAICGGPPEAEVLGLDIDIRSHNRVAIEAHPLFKRITLLEGSSIAPEVIQQVQAKATHKQRILVSLDSNHTHDHVLAELQAYAPLTSVGSYCVVFDTVIEQEPEICSVDRPWGQGNNPMTAVQAYLEHHPEFEIDHQIDNQLLISVAPSGYLKRVR